jgi:high-affinity nickel permease
MKPQFRHRATGFEAVHGFVIVAMFALTWAVALSVWHFGKIEQKWDLAAARANAGD